MHIVAGSKSIVVSGTSLVAPSNVTNFPYQQITICAPCMVGRYASGGACLTCAPGRYLPQASTMTSSVRCLACGVGTGPKSLVANGYLSSPIPVTVANQHNNFYGCGSEVGNAYIFFFTMQPSQTINIRLNLNGGSDSKQVSLFWSVVSVMSVLSASNQQSTCEYVPYSQQLTSFSRTNTLLEAQKLWFVVNGFSPTQGSLNFTIMWDSVGTNGECAACSAGRHDHDRNASTACAACTSGRFSPNTSATQCAACGVGTQATVSGASACTPCSAGRHDHDRNASTACAACTSGRFSANTSATQCAACGVGTDAASVVLANSQITSPFTFTTAGRRSVFLGCGSTAGNTYKLFFRLERDQTIMIRLFPVLHGSSNQIAVFWSSRASDTAQTGHGASTPPVDIIVCCRKLLSGSGQLDSGYSISKRLSRAPTQCFIVLPRFASTPIEVPVSGAGRE